MNLSVGIVGLPNSGKSTLFNALLKRQIAQVAEYPYTTIEPNVGVVEVPDGRLDQLADMIRRDPSTSLRMNRPQVIPTAIQFIDIAGLIKGAHKGEGLGNQFLAKIREASAILHVVRAFENPNVPHVHGKIDPLGDIEVVNTELALGGIKKPTIYVINLAEGNFKNESIHQLKGLIANKYQTEVVVICAKLEADLPQLTEEEQKAYLVQLGIERSGLDQVIGESYRLLDLITFFTVAGGKQVQAWPIKSDSKMIEAAAMVHTDMARGFIAAEIIDWQKLVEAGSWVKAREKGLIKTIGKNEQIDDGYVVEFKFSV